MSIYPTESRNPNLYFDIAKGLIPGHVVYNILGHRETIASGVTCDVWNGIGNNYPFQSIAGPTSISGSNINDDINGTGARTLIVEGLNSQFIETNQLVSMIGQTEIFLPIDLIRVNRILVLTAGSQERNQGIIRCRINGQIVALLKASDNRLFNVVYTIPAHKYGFLTTINASTNTYLSCNVEIRGIGGVFIVERQFHISSSSYLETVSLGRVIDGPADIVMKVTNYSSAGDISGNIKLIIINDIG